MTHPMSAPNRRWLRWSLRTMFVVVTVVGMFAALSRLEPVRRFYYGFSPDDLPRIENFPKYIPELDGEQIVGIEYVGKWKVDIITSPPSDPTIRHRLRARKVGNGKWSLDQVWTEGETPYFREDAR